MLQSTDRATAGPDMSNKGSLLHDAPNEEVSRFRSPKPGFGRCAAVRERNSTHRCRSGVDAVVTYCGVIWRNVHVVGVRCRSGSNGVWWRRVVRERVWSRLGMGWRCRCICIEAVRIVVQTVRSVSQKSDAACPESGSKDSKF
jgi:hypothetical protein